MLDKLEVLKVYQSGALTVVGFGNHDILDQVSVMVCRDEIAQIIESTKCKTLAFDLTGVKLIPSGLLGLLASLKELGVEVHLYNPSSNIRDVLEITRLDQIMRIHEIEL